VDPDDVMKKAAYPSAEALRNARWEPGGRRTPPMWRVIEKQEVLCQEDAESSCCTRDEGGPFGAVLQGKASNRHELLRLNTAVVNVMVKRRGNDRVRYE
jgi:hypothetical protein